MAANTLQKITTRAKAIRKAHPKKKWTDCIKAAAKELKGGKKIGATPPLSRLKVKKVRAKAAPTKKTRTVTVKKVQTLAGIPSFRGQYTEAKDKLDRMKIALPAVLRLSKSKELPKEVRADKKKLYNELKKAIPKQRKAVAALKTLI